MARRAVGADPDETRTMAAMARRKRRSALPPPPSPPVVAGLVGPLRTVPTGIARPDYAATGIPSDRGARAVRTPDEITAMRIAGRVAAAALVEVGNHVRPGISTDELDRIGHEAMVAAGAYPSTLNYRGYPKSLCSSVNEVICHGIPDSRRLQDGDIVNIDVTAFIEGVHGDTSATFLVGDVDERSAALVATTRAAMHAGIDVVRPGARVHEIGRAIEAVALPEGYSVVREFIGHGIGEQFHTSLQIPHYHDPRHDTVLEPGMTFTIEPMINVGSAALEMWDDDWTVVTRDLQRSAQFEHTVLVTDDGHELLTVPADGPPAEVLFAGVRSGTSPAVPTD
jgi:methionyl aminopeptidase